MPSVRPAFVQVGSTRSSMTSVCPLAGISFCAVRTSLQTEQCFPSVRPGLVQVGFTPSLITSVCPLAGISFCATSTSLQTEQCFPSVRPGLVQVGSVPSSMTSLCPLAGISFCAVSTSSQTEQCVPSVRPVLVQVGSTRWSVTSVCPSAGTASALTVVACVPCLCFGEATTVCLTKTVPQTEQIFPSVRPVLEQVAATAGTICSVCSVVSPSILENVSLIFLPGSDFVFSTSALALEQRYPCTVNCMTLEPFALNGWQESCSKK